MIKKIAALLATVVIIGSAASVSAVRVSTGTGEWNYGANIIQGTYSKYWDAGPYKWWSATVWTPTPWEPHYKTQRVSSGTAYVQKSFFLWDDTNWAYYNRGN